MISKATYIAETLPQLEKWAATYREVEAQMAVLRALLGTEVERPLPKAVYAMFDEYTAAVSRSVGDSDDWLAWHCHDNSMGTGSLGAIRKWSGKRKKVKTLKHLAEVIWECQP